MVLVVESDDTLREAIEEALGVVVSTVSAGSGRRGLQLFEETSPEIVIINAQLRDMDGLDFLRYVRQCRPGTRLIVTSDSGDYHLVRKTIELGVDDFLEKPYEMEDLYRSLHNCIRGVPTLLDDRILTARYHEKSRHRRQQLLVAT